MRHKSVKAFILALAIGSFAITARAQSTLNSQFIVSSDTIHSSTSSKPGDPFAFRMAQAYCQGIQCVPAGTLLTGEIVKVRRSKMFHRPGYIGLHIDKAVFSDGSSVAMTSKNPQHIDMKIYHHRAQNLNQFVLGEIPDTAVYAGASKALTEFNEAWHLSPACFTATSLGASALLGVVIEFVHPDNPDEHRSIMGHIAKGLVDSTGIPDVVHLFRHDPEATISEGETLRVKLSADNTERLYKHSMISTTTDAATNPLTPPALQADTIKLDQPLVTPLKPDDEEAVEPSSSSENAL